MAKIGAVAVALVVIICLVVGFSCSTTVPAGYVAVQYNMRGGIMDEVLTQGWHITPPTIKTSLYSVSLNQSYLTSGEQGDSKEDESFSASTSEGKAVTIDLTFTYQYDANDVVDVFTRFKGQSGTEIRDSFIKPNIVSWSKEVIARYKVAHILGAERANVNIALTEYLSNKFAPYGISISNVSLINIEVDDETMKAINAKITAQQNAETQAINNQTAIEKANAEAEVLTTHAQAEADALLIGAQAQAEANGLLSKSITDEVLVSEWIERWNGELPTYMASDGSMDSFMLGLNGNPSTTTTNSIG